LEVRLLDLLGGGIFRLRQNVFRSMQNNCLLNLLTGFDKQVKYSFCSFRQVGFDDHKLKKSKKFNLVEQGYEQTIAVNFGCKTRQQRLF